MSEWVKMQLGDAIQLKRGYDLPNQKRVTGAVPIVSSSGVSDFHNTAKVKAPGVITGRYGTIGQVFYVDKDFWPLNTTLYVEDFKTNEPLFISYFLRTLDFQAFAAKSAVPGINRNDVHLAEIMLPDKCTQKQISSVLVAYDNLIENNNRRIAILEEMAQRLYREWFVHFRFPGHENAEMVASEFGMIPEGWRAMPFSEMAVFINGYAFKPSDWHKTGLPIIKIAELKNGVTSNTPYYPNDLPDKYLVHNGDILFSWSADLNAYIWSGGDGWLNQHLFQCIPKMGRSKIVLYFSLLSKMSAFIDNTTGSTMKHIKKSELDIVKTVDPHLGVQKDFDIRVSPIINEIICLSHKTKILRKTRDHLLPRLISGDIDVSKIEL